MTNELKLMFLLAVEVLFVSALSIQGARMRDAALGGGRISHSEILIIICVMVAFFFLGVLARRYQSVAGLWALCLIVAVLGTVIDALEGKHSRLELIGGLIAVQCQSRVLSFQRINNRPKNCDYKAQCPKTSNRLVSSRYHAPKKERDHPTNDYEDLAV